MPVKGNSLVLDLKPTETAKSKPWARPTKNAPAKAKPKERSSVTVIKKRSPPTASKTEGASKIQKTVPKANSGKRVNGRGASVLDAYVISDDDDDFYQPRQQSRTDSLTPPRQMLKIDSSGSEDDLNPIPTPTSTQSNNLDNGLMRMKVVHLKELEQLRQQLNASEAKVKQIKEEAKREAIKLQRQQCITSDKHMADLEEEIEAERHRSNDLTWECDYLRREMEAAHNCLEGEADLIQQREGYKRLYKEEQDNNANLRRGLIEKDEESTRKATEMEKEIQQLAKQIEDLQREVTQLVNENAALRASSLSQYAERRSSASPAPSQSSSVSNQEQRLVNIRKTYIAVKKRYDNLHSVATNISTATRSWDYANFGEFGQYLGQLKTALDENGLEEQAINVGR